MYKKIYWVTSSNREVSFMNDVCEIIKFKGGKPFEFSCKEDELIFFFPQGRELREPPKLNGNVLNYNLKSVVLASNKIECRKVLATKGIPIPKTWFHVKDAKIPYIIRRQYHSMGMEMEIVQKMREHRFQEKVIKNKHKKYFSELLDVDKEYRAIVLKDQIILVYDRDWQDDIYKTIIKRNRLRRQGANFKRREASDEISEQHKQICVDAMKAIGLEYGAVDFVIDKKGDMYVLELNTRPFMDGKIVKDALIKSFEDLKEGKPLTPFKYEVK